MAVGPMVALTSAPNVFAARVVAARLGAEGFLWELHGNVDGPYPVGVVDVLVAQSDLVDARYLLLADEIEASYADMEHGADGTGDDGVLTGAAARAPRALWFVLLSIVSTALFSLGRLLVGF